MVEEKHFDPDGVCRMDVHFAPGQPYLSRKHYFPTQRLKSELMFFVEDEWTLRSRKAGYWREYHENGGLKSEIQYDRHGIRCGFCKRYGDDGSVRWMKDYTKEYNERVQQFNAKTTGIQQAAKMFGFDGPPRSSAEVNSEYRKLCALYHPDKSSDPDATHKFVELQRARDFLLTCTEV